ncbi:MAG: ATP-binding protein [Deltaproteobacteria bacterium]|nr:ATP-binding protein [Deltaproteobacteria bacterium]
MEADLEQLLRRYNPWLWSKDTWPDSWALRMPEHFVPRLPVNWTGAFPANKVTLVIGPRQSGKSTFLWSELRDVGPDVVLVNCEEPLFRTWCRSPAEVLGQIAELAPRPRAMLFEEVQHLDEAGLFLKGLVDLRPGCPVLVTGSSSFHLTAKTRESLAGRAQRLRMLPFSLREMSFDLVDLPPAVRAYRQAERLQRMLIYGSYPEAWLSDDPSGVLASLLEGVIVKDASDLFRIDHPEAYRKLLKLMASQIGNLVNLAEWAALCGVSSKTVRRYASILEEAHVVSLLRPWVSGKRAELTGTPKVYFCDNGIRNAALARFHAHDRRNDLGALWENWAFAEIQKSIRPLLDGCGFWRTRSGAEVDFVVETGGRLLAVEVKAGVDHRRRVGRAARSFIEAIGPDLFVMLHAGERFERELLGCRIVWIGPAELASLLGR